MRAAIVGRHGGPEVLRIQEVPRPVPGRGEVLVRIKAIGLNFADVVERLGVYPGIPKPPFIPGMEFSGIVEDVGNGVTQYRGGERVMGYCFVGSHAEYVAVPVQQTDVVPENMSFEEGAAFLVANLTAYHGLVTLARAQRREKVLVHAAAGSVGLAAIQLAKYLGLEVFAAASTEKKLAAAQGQGADHLINYVAKKFDEEVLRASDGYGLDIVFDSVGGRLFKPGWSILAPMGRYVLYGFADAFGVGKFNKLKAAGAYFSMPRIHPASLPSLNRALIGFNLSKLTQKVEYLRTAAKEIRRLHEEGILKPIVGKVFRFEEIRQAHEFLQSRKSIGKTVIVV
jgi:NADPH:quinone reductase-like Zn-dependent oxidoreductase